MKNLLQWWHRNTIQYQKLDLLKQENIKVAFIGQQQCGQTSVINQFLHKEFDTITPTTIATKEHVTTILSSTKEIVLTIHDINTQLGLNSVHSSIMNPNISIYFLCYDVTSIASLNWITKAFLPQYQTALANKKIIFVGCKNDLESNPDIANKVKELTETIAGSFSYQCSAKNNVNIEQIFNESIEEFLNAKNLDDIDSEEDNDNKQTKCCGFF